MPLYIDYDHKTKSGISCLSLFWQYIALELNMNTRNTNAKHE